MTGEIRPEEFFRIRPALPAEAAALSEMAMRSKVLGV